jgi:hypothetical protein
MRGSLPFRLNRSGFLLTLISAAFAGEAGAAAARVDFTTAGVTVAGRDGQARPLARGVELDSGDTVRTSSEGRAQLRFSDGSYVSLQPNTDFSISEYKFEGKDDDRGFFGLLKGAMRTVTGAVGRVNRNSYRITTPTATVGIRGTGGVIQVQNDGSTLVIGTSGIWSLTNPAGSIDIPAGVSGLAPTEPNTPPKETSTQPQTSPAPVQPQQTQFVQGEQVNAEGEAILTTSILPPLVSGAGYGSALAWFAFESANMPSGGGGNAVFNDLGQLTELTSSSGITYKMGGSHADFGTDGILAWGRWIGDVGISNANGGTSVVNYPDNQGFHYVIGMPTAVMPTAGTATYSLIGATQPTYEFSNQLPGTFSGQLTVNFGSRYTVSGDFRAQMPDRLYAWSGSASGSSSPFFSMSPSSVSGCANSTGCTAQVNGFFAGANAERAGISYVINDFSRVGGAAAFKKN